MGHPLRPRAADTTYHVFTRGSGKQAISVDDLDKEILLNQLAGTALRSGWIIYSWCFMDNHYHLVVNTPEPNLSAGMQQLNGTFARIFNRRHERCDHLFRNRFRSKVVKTDEYLLEACRYTILNPHRAGLVKTADEWRWSSYRATLDLSPCPKFFEPQRLLELFDKDPLVAQRLFADFIRSAGGPTSLAELEALLTHGPLTESDPPD
jgi:putative transposase